MGDFFTRLAEKTLGLAPVVQPDLVPVAQPAADGEVVSDSLPRLEETFERTTTPDADSISQNMSITEIATVAGDGPQSLTQGWDQAVALPARDDRAVNRQLEAPMPMTQAKQNVVELDRNHLNREFETGAQTSPAEIRQSAHASAVMAQSKPSEVRPPATPTMQISIGSVEIRAVTPPTAVPQRSAERRGNPRLSLEEYLRQRNEGRR